jgi:hypothetical protein
MKQAPNMTVHTIVISILVALVYTITMMIAY